MNELGRQTLINAALRGQEQHFGSFSDGGDKLCGLGVLLHEAGARMPLNDDSIDSGDWVRAQEMYEWKSVPDNICRLCDFPGDRGYSDTTFIAHLNDVHRLDFIGIAQKMGVKEETL